MLKVVEAFSGIGSQAEALKNTSINHNIEAIIEWEVTALFAYDIMHNGPQNLKDYRFHTKQSLIKELSKHNLSASGKEKVTERALSAMPMNQLKGIIAAIERTNNLIDISEVKAEELPDDLDVLTYSFPCQDLSISSFWHNNTSGIDKDADNRSGLLWQVERILQEYCNVEKSLPKFLLMENVSAILSNRHIKNFHMWQNFLEELGYVNKVYTLNSRNFGIPQERERTFMISVLVKEDQKKSQAVENYFFENNLENVYRSDDDISSLSNYLKLDYSNEVYKKEAIGSTPNYTASREKIFYNNRKLAIDDRAIENTNSRTLTTKQDRNPNSGIIQYKNNPLVSGAKYRNLTPRECFLLMGFSEEAFDNLMAHDIITANNRNFLTASKIYRLTGNSIVVPILEEIFKQIDFIDKNILNCHVQPTK